MRDKMYNKTNKDKHNKVSQTLLTVKVRVYVTFCRKSYKRNILIFR